MQSPTPRRDNSDLSLGERRGKSDLARFSLDLSWARAASDSARSRAYPSPPMSGSPPLPPRRNPDSSDRGHGVYGSGGQDVYRGMPAPMEHMEQRGQVVRSYVPEHVPSMSYPGQYRSNHMPVAPMQYQQTLPQLPLQQQQQHHQMHGFPPHPQQITQPFSVPDRPLIREPAEFHSPKQQRKTKGHVASACVPCKRAHLRCDAQRPCSRCTSNGKEDACIDVQHKKRGRPRLRDERESRYEIIGAGFPPPADPSMRRPLSLYSPAEPSPFSQDVPRSGSYRVLKSQGGGPISGGPRFLEHASAADANIYRAPMPMHMPMPPVARIQSSHETPCAYLTMEMQFSKTTQSFGETIGVHSVQSRRLQDVVSPNDREKIARLQRVFEDERRETEPNYLPPIYMAKFEEDHVIQSQGFGQEDFGLMRTDRLEMFTFQAPDGQQRTFQVRLSLAKRNSTFFIVLLLLLPATPQPFHQPSSPPYREQYPRDSQYGYQTPQQGYQQPLGVSPFALQPGYGDPRGDMATYRTPGTLGPSMPSSAPMMGFSQPQRVEYMPGPAPYQTPRSELPQPPVQVQTQRPHDLQLPPIRDQRSEAPPTDPLRRRDDRSGRVDIGGLLEQPGRRGP